MYEIIGSFLTAFKMCTGVFIGRTIKNHSFKAVFYLAQTELGTCKEYVGVPASGFPREELKPCLDVADLAAY